jgi:hypothetical protein
MYWIKPYTLRKQIFSLPVAKELHLENISVVFFSLLEKSFSKLAKMKCVIDILVTKFSKNNNLPHSILNSRKVAKNIEGC